jgi:HD-like signal output (HDOD) protein
MPTAQEIVASNVTLVSLPAIYTSVKAVIDDPRSGAMDLAKVLAADPAMTARVLKLVNSAFWGVSRQVDSLPRAVSLIGMLQIHDLVLASSVIDSFAGIKPALMDVRKFWRSSVLRGLAASALAREAALVDVGRVFTEGLLSDLGHMVLFTRFPEQASRALEQTRDRPWELAQAETALIGCSYAQVGGALTDAWQLPPCFGDSIRHQVAPQEAGTHALEASLLHIAGALALADTHQAARKAIVAQIEPSAWRETELDADCLDKLRPEIDANLSATLQLFGV